MRSTAIATAAAVVLAAGLLQAQPPTPRDAPVTKGEGTTDPVTLTGCVKPWELAKGAIVEPGADIGKVPPAGAPAGATPPGATPGQVTASTYVLTNVTASGTPVAGNAATYLLQGQSASANLAQHVNHRVEVTGTIVMGGVGPAGTTASGSTPTSPVGTAPGSPETPSGTPGTPPTLTFTSLKMVATTCP